MTPEINLMLNIGSLVLLVTILRLLIINRPHYYRAMRKIRYILMSPSLEDLADDYIRIVHISGNYGQCFGELPGKYLSINYTNQKTGRIYKRVVKVTKKEFYSDFGQIMTSFEFKPTEWLLSELIYKDDFIKAAKAERAAQKENS